MQYVDESGDVRAGYEYSPFGKTIAATGTMADEFDFRFSTKQWDTELGLYYYGYRHYQPNHARWLTRDPIEEQGGMNVYGFVGNDAVGRWDYLGMWFHGIEDIPRIMEEKHFYNGAKLMRSWFTKGYNHNWRNGIPDTNTIKMDSWVLKFERAKIIYDELIKSDNLFSKNGKLELKDIIKNNYISAWKNGGKFGNFSKKIDLLEKEHFQSKVVESNWYNLNHPIDDLFAALGTFQLKVVAEGNIDKNCIKVKKVGIFAQDQYEFSQWHQPLGFFDSDMNHIGREPLGVLVYNLNFKMWRSRNKKGYDFPVYSDLKQISVNESFEK